MSNYGSQKDLSMSRRAGSRGDLSGGMIYTTTRSGIMHGGGNDPFMEGHNNYTFSRSSYGGGGKGGGMMSVASGMMSGGGAMMSGPGGGMMSGGGGMMSGMMSGGGGMSSGTVSGMGGGMSGSGSIHQRAMILQAQCQDYLKKAEYALQSGGAQGDAELYMSMAKETIDQLKNCANDLRQMGQPSDNVLRTLDMCRDQLKGVHMAMTGSLHRRRSTRGSSGGWEEPGRSFQDAMGWIAQQKRLIETASWGDDPAAIDQQLVSHQKFQSSIQRSPEVDRAKDDLMRKGDKGNLHLLEQEWDSLQQMSFGRTEQLQDLKRLIQEMSKEIMWVNDREEEELVFDWGDKNIDTYIPRKQESYSKLMSALEVKEKDLNKLKTKVDLALKKNHPASDKIEAYQDTLQTQWSWLLQITKCIDVHLKENAAYSQFFKEANETYSDLQKEHETVRKLFTCDKNTSLDKLLELLEGLRMEKEKIKENKRQVQHLVSQSRNIVRLKPRNPEEKSNSPIIVKALCDFKQDQKVICKDNEAILKDNSQRSKWAVTGPGGLDMSVPSVCLLVPPPNPLCVSLANKNEQYYEAILSIWNQLYINVKSLIAWQYCVMDIKKINSLTLSMLARMRPEEYRQLISSLETHYEEFRLNSHGSQMFTDEDKRSIENQFTGAQAHYDHMVVQLPTYIAQQEEIEVKQAASNQQQLLIIQQQEEMEARMREEEARRLAEERRRAEEARRCEEEARRLEEERRRAEAKKVKKSEISKSVVKVVKTEPVKRAKISSISSSHSLSELHALRLRLEAAEGSLSQHVHICLGDDGIHECGLKITQLETVQRDINMMREEYLRLRERIMKELEGMNDSDKAQFLRSEIDIINDRLGGLESTSSAYMQRLQALRDLLASVAQAEDIVKVHEARLTEKETTSLSPSEVEDYILTLKNVKAELDQKKAVLASMEAELANANHWNCQVGGQFHRCDIMLSKYNDQVNLLSDRWRRIDGQIDTRLQDLQVYQPQLQQYKQTSTSLIDWIDDTRKKQDALQATKIESVQELSDHIKSQKALNSEIKAKRETIENVLRENATCVNSIKDYETDLASYTSGLETLLNIPIKRTMLKSPSMDLNLEATQMQTRYMELLTQSGDYYKFLGELQKNMEELKIRNTRIDLLEEELRLLRESMEDRNNKNKSLEEAVAHFKLELSTAQDQLLTMEEVKSSTALQNNATRESLDNTQSQLADLNDEVGRLNYLLEEEKRKRKLAEERYTMQQDEYELVLKKRQKELETVSWSKMEVEKSEASKDHEIEQLRRQLAETAERIKEQQKELSKVRSQCSKEINNIKLSYESQLNVSHTDIQRLAAQREEDTADLQLQYDRMEAERRNLEEELRRLRMSTRQTEDQLKRAEEEAYSQRAIITEEGRRRREIECQVEVLMRQRDEEGKRFAEELAVVMQRLQEKSQELTYIAHSLEEETRRRKTIEEGKAVLEQSLAQMQVKLTSSSKTANELGGCKEELQKMRLELDRESKDRSRVEENMSRLQGRMKDLQEVRDGLESQVENLRKANQDEVSKRRQVEKELENTTMAIREYSTTVTALRKSQENASMSEKRDGEERLRLQEELDRESRERRLIEENMSRLQSRLEELQEVRVGLESQVENLRRTNQEEVSKRRQVEQEFESTNKTIKEYSTTVTALRQSQENASLSEKRGGEERLRLQEELDRESRERRLLEENMSRLQSCLKEYQDAKVGLERQVESLMKANQEEVSRRRQIEKELETTTTSMTEYSSTITTLRKNQEQASISEKRAGEERFRLQEELEKSLKQNKTSAERMAQLSTEMKAQQQQLLQEQARVKEANLRNESLYKTIEEKSKTLNEWSVDLQRLKEITETQTKERLRLEEELRATRQDKEELRQSQQGRDEELSSQITALELQLKASERSYVDCRNLVSELSSENEKLKMEIEQKQKQAIETTTLTQSQYSEIVSERDDLLLKLQLLQKEKDRCQRLEEDLSRVKLSQESELRNKQRLQEENDRMKRDSSYWKDQCDSKQNTIRQYDSDKERMEREKNSLKSEIERLMRELRELEEMYKSKLSASQKEMEEMNVVRKAMVSELSSAPPTLDPSTLVFDGVRKPVTANQLLDCGVLDQPTFSQLVKGQKTIPDVSVDKKVSLKGTGPIAGLVIGDLKGSGSMTGVLSKMTFSEAKKENLLPADSIDLLLDAQAATGHIIDPRTNQKLTVEEACDQGVVDEDDKDRLLAAEAAAVGYRVPGSSKPLSAFQAMEKGMIDKETALRLLQAQESVGGILDPELSVFLPKDTAIERKLVNKEVCQALNKRPQLYLDPESEEGVTYMSMKRRCKVDPHTGLLLLPIPEKVDPSKLVFDGVRKPVTAKQLFDCDVLDKPTLKDLEWGKKTVPEVSDDKIVNLKGTGPIAGVVVGSKGKMSLTEAKKQMLLSEESAGLLLEAQAATGHIIDPKDNKKLTVEEACAKGVVDIKDRDKLLAAEAAAVGYKDSSAAKPLSAFEAMKKDLIDKNTAVRLLQAQESVGGILDPSRSVFLPTDTAIKHKLLDDNLRQALKQIPECYLDPETERNASYGALKKRCKTEPHTGLLLLPITERLDPSKLIFDGVRKPVTAKELLDCGVLDKQTFSQLQKGEKTVPEVSDDKIVNLKGTGPIAGVVCGSKGKMSLTEAKKQMLLPEESAGLLLEAQAATGHIIDPKTNKKLTVEEACAKGVVDIKDRDKLLAAEAAAVGYKDSSAAKLLSVFEAMKKDLIDKNTAVRLLQAQESVGGILDPSHSVFLPTDTAIKRKLLDDNLRQALKQIPECYLDPETERDASYGALKKRCKTEPHTGLLLLPITERLDPSKLIFDGVRKPVTAKELLDCGVLDKQTFNQLQKGEKTVPEVSEAKKVPLKGRGSIAAVAAGPLGKMSIAEAKKQMVMTPESADLLLDAQAAIGHIVDPTNNQKLTVEEACARGVVDNRDRDRLLAAETAAVGYQDPSAAKPLSLFEAMKKGRVDRNTTLRLLQAQESAGGILDPNLSVFLPTDTAIKRNLLDEELSRALNQNPACYLDPDTEREASYDTLKKKSKTESHTGLIILPITERKNPSKLMFDGIRKPVSAQELFECGVLDKPTLDQLVKGEKTVPAVSKEIMVYLKGTGSIAAVGAGPQGKMSLTEAKKLMIMPPESADLLLEAQAATGHIIDPKTSQKLTVEEACARGVLDIQDRDKLLAAEAAAVGYKDRSAAKPLSVFEEMKKGRVDRNTTIRLLQAQESAGGILDPNRSVFLPKEIAIKHNLLDEELSRALNQNPACYLDPDTERETSYDTLKNRSKTESHTGLIILPITERKNPSKLMFDGIRKPVSAQELFECGVLDKPTLDQLVKGEKTVQALSKEIMVYLKGTGSIAAVGAGPQGKMSLTEAKKLMIMPPESADLLLVAQAATGHIIDPKTNQKLTVEEACARGVVDIRDRDKLLAAEAAAVGYKDRSAAKPLSVFEEMKKGRVDRNTTLRLLQAQESAGGILDPNLSVFLPKQTAIKRNLLDEELSRALNQNPACYMDPDTEREASYDTLKNRSKTESHTGLIILPITERKNPSKLMFDGIRKPVSAQELFECGVLDKPTLDQLVKGEKTVPAVSKEIMVYLKGTGSIAAVGAGPQGKMSLTEAKKLMIMPPESADLLLEAQAATGHIIDPKTSQKLTVEEACARGVVDIQDRDKLLAAEAAAVGYKDRSAAKPLSVFEEMKKGRVDRNTTLRLLQAQESAGGILDPNLSVFLPKQTAIKRNLLDEELSRALNQNPACYMDPDTEREASYDTLKNRSKTESHTGLIILPITERKNPSKLMFDGIRKPVSAQELFECGVLDKPTLDQLVKGEKTVQALSKEIMVYLKGTGSIGGVVAGPQGKMSLTEAKKLMIMPPESADLLLEAQAATGHIIDPKTSQKLTVEEACARGVLDIQDRDKLLAAEAAAVGYKDRSAAKTFSVFEAMKKGRVDRKTALRLLQAQESAGGILDPNRSVFLPKEIAIKHNLLDEELSRALNQNPACYLDPDTERETSYGALKEKCKTEPEEVLQLLPVAKRVDPSKLLFEGVRKTVTAQQLVDCGILDKPTFNQLVKGEKTVPEVSVDKKVFLKGTGSISGVAAGPFGKMTLTEAKKQKIMSPDSADMLLEAQAATGIIMDPRTHQKLTVKEACARGVVDRGDESKLFAAEAAAIGYKDPISGKLLSAGQAMKKGLIDRDTALRVLQAQESVGGILDPVLGIFLPKETARDRDLIDEDLYQALNQSPECYLDPDTQQPTTYVSLKKKCKADPSTGLLLLPEPKKPMTFQGLRDQVSVIDLVDANLLNQSDMNKLREGRLASKEIEDRLGCYLRGSTCIAGVHDEVSDKVMSIYQAMKEGLLQPGTTLELLEAQAASGFIVDPVKNQYLTVSDAYNKRLFGPEFKDNLLSAERAVTGYKLPGTDKVISLFQAIERGLVEKGHGIRLLEAQIACGGIIDPEHSHRIDVNVAYKRGYFDEEMNKILTDPNVNTKGFFDPNTEENLTYLELKNRCIKDRKTGLVLLPIMEKKKQESTLKNTLRKRRVIIVDPETNKEMSVREAYDKGLIDFNTFKELSEQECEWEEITITAPDGSVRFLIVDKKSGREYDISDLLERGVIHQSDLERYRSRAITLTEFADIIGRKAKPGSLSSSTSRSSAAGLSSVTSSTSRTSGSPGTSSELSSSLTTSRTSAYPDTSSVTSTSTLRTSEYATSSSSSSSSSNSSTTVLTRPLSPTLAKMTTTRTTTVTERSSTFSSGARDSPDSLRGISSVSITLASPAETVGEQAPVGAVFDTDTMEKITITEARNRDLVDSITAQRLLEAQACTGGIINPTNGQRFSIQEATRLGIIDDDMAPRLKPAQKAFFGFEDVKTRKKMSAAQAMKEMWLPYEAGQRFLEYQYVTGGLYDPEMGCRRTLEDAVRMGWLDERAAQKLRDIRHHTKNLTCPKSKLKISYKEALENCMVEEGNGVKMLQASSVSSKGISSPYNVSSTPGSSTGSRSGSRRGSRRSSVDLGSPTSSSTSRSSHTITSFSSTST